MRVLAGKIVGALALVVLAAGCTVDGAAKADAAVGDGDGAVVVDVDAGVVGGDAAVTGVGCAATDPRSVPVTVSVLPEAGETPFTSVLDGAQRSIRVMVYLMGRGAILDTLKRKAREGKQVRVILDGEQQRDVNQKYFDELTAAGAQVVWGDANFPYMHAKIIVVDEREATIATGNYSLQFSIAHERNFVARVADGEDVADLVALFDADFTRGTVDLSCTRLLVSPLNARARLLALIASAQTSVFVESMQLADTEVRAALVARKRAGVDVRALIAAPSWITANSDAAQFLGVNGIPARWLDQPAVHVKAMVIDGARAYVGSENLSYTSLSRNREVGIIITDLPAVAVMASTFDRDWAAATPF